MLEVGRPLMWSCRTTAPSSMYTTATRTKRVEKARVVVITAKLASGIEMAIKTGDSNRVVIVAILAAEAFSDMKRRWILPTAHSSKSQRGGRALPYCTPDVRVEETGQHGRFACENGRQG